MTWPIEKNTYPGFDHIYGAGKGQGSRTQVDSKTLCMNIPIGIFINLRAWNRPGPVLSPK